LRTEASSIARDESQVIAYVVVEAGVKSLGVDARETISSSVGGKELLYATYNLCFSEDRRYRELLEEVCGFQPVATAIVAVVGFGFYV
jgi:hypothetical protein